ncbi:hypothetical protein O181_053193 [Austropuccinia psidii MF-1]|uniref:Uncharacterized protein n=1 Tax=Austropuccinia psidii MF-1 TaxID=1389203 RepID=A0A9Q3E6Y0_9BASI|nr:hypothetical protein [Austropuccinia psidii MF-1]
MRPKGAKGGSPVAKIPGGPTLACFWPKNQETQNDQKAQNPQIGPRTQDNQFGHKWPHPSRFKPWPLEITRGPQPPSISGFSSRSGRLVAQLDGPKSAGTKSGAYIALYTIMHHFPSAIQW